MNKMNYFYLGSRYLDRRFIVKVTMTEKFTRASKKVLLRMLLSDISNKFNLTVESFEDN